MTLGIKHTGLFWKIHFLCCPTDKFLVLYILFYFPGLKNACACLCSYFMCPYLHICNCTLNNDHLISLRNSCSLDTSCRRSDTLFLEYNTDVNAR